MPKKKSHYQKSPFLTSFNAIASLEDVAKVLNLTRERVRQIEVKALFKVQKILAEKRMLDKEFWF